MSKYNSTEELLNDILKFLMLGVTPEGRSLDVRNPIDNDTDIDKTFEFVYETTLNRIDDYGKKYQVLIGTGLDTEDAEYEVRKGKSPVPILDTLHPDDRDDFLDLIFEYFEVDEDEETDEEETDIEEETDEDEYE